MDHVDPIAVLGSIDPRQVGTDEFVALLDTVSQLATSGADIDLSSLHAAQFSRLISRASTEQLEGIVRRPELRQPILDEVFRRMGEHYQPGKAGASAVVRFRIGNDGTDQVRYECVLKNTSLTVNKPPKHDSPNVTIMLGPVEFLRLAAGSASGAGLFMKGKLKIAGDLGLAAGLVKMFQIPAS